MSRFCGGDKDDRQLAYARVPFLHSQLQNPSRADNLGQERIMRSNKGLANGNGLRLHSPT